MQLDSTDPVSAEIPDGLLHTASVIPNPNAPMTEESVRNQPELTKFYSQYIDNMTMYADLQTVATYFDAHHSWFRRCAHPMKAEPLGKNGYALVIGRFGSYGYVVEPKIGLDLLPQDNGIYRIETIPVPDYVTNGYDVDFRAAMELVEQNTNEFSDGASYNGTSTGKMTQVQWQLDLTVSIQFPRFIHRALPKQLIQTTGDRLLQQIVRQVSQRLTHKVLEDFHTSHGVPIPSHSKRWFQRRSDSDMDFVTE
jgi:hypothetical protein